MNVNLPSEAEFAFAIKFLLVAAVAGMVLLGARYLFEKRGVTIAVLAGIGLFGLLMLAWTRASVRVHATGPFPITEPMTKVSVSAPALHVTPSPAQHSSSAIQQIIGSNAPINVTELPSWVKNPPHEGSLGAGHCKYVLTSQLYATPEEAEAELNKQLTVDVQQSFTVANSPVEGWSPTAADLRMSGLIKEKVIETVPMKVGEFDTSVQRVSWLIEFNSATQHSLLVLWQFDEAQRRSKLILSALAAISGVIGVSSFVLRRKPNSSASVSSVNQLA